MLHKQILLTSLPYYFHAYPCLKLPPVIDIKHQSPLNCLQKRTKAFTNNKQLSPNSYKRNNANCREYCPNFM